MSERSFSDAGMGESGPHSGADMTEELHPLLKEPAAEIPAAIALALSGDRTALDPLRRIVAERLDTVPETLRNEPHRQEYCAIGVWLLGWLDDTYSLRRIADFFQERRNFTASLNAMNALLRIGERHAELRERIGEILLDGLSAPLPELPVPCFCSPQTLDGLNRLRILAAGRLNRWGIPHSFEELLKQASLGIVERKRVGKESVMIQVLERFDRILQYVASRNGTPAASGTVRPDRNFAVRLFEYCGEHGASRVSGSRTGRRYVLGPTPSLLIRSGTYKEWITKAAPRFWRSCERINENCLLMTQSGGKTRGAAAPEEFLMNFS